MKKTLRILSLMLVMVMMVSALAACGGEKNPVETGNPSASEKNPTTQTPQDPVKTQAPSVTDAPQDPEKTQAPSVTEAPQDPVVDKWADVNFGGTELIVEMNNWEPTSMINAGASNSIKYIKGPDEYTTDAVQNAVFDRNNKVTSKLGLDIIYNEDTYSSGGGILAIENFVLADLEDSPDVMQAPGYSMLRAGIKGLLYNALTDDEDNYFDITEENGWYADLMLDNTLDESKVFVLAGDYFIDILRCAYSVFVNIDMYEELFASEGGVETLYQTVNDGDWTYDELMRLADAAYVDRGTAGSVDEVDTFGVAAGAWWYYRTFFSTSGLDIFEETADGKIAYVQDVSEIHTFVDKLTEMLSHDSFLNPHTYANNDQGPYEVTKLFTSGGTLFALDQFVLNIEGTNIRSMSQKVGVVPFPKYNEDTEYGALVSDNANFGGILYNSDKFTESSAFLQMMCEESNKGKGSVIYEYYDVTLKYKYSADAGQIQMLETIRNGLCSPKSFTYDNYFAQDIAGVSTYGSVIKKSTNSGTNTFASDWASQVGAVQQALEDTYKIYGLQD